MQVAIAASRADESETGEPSALEAPVIFEWPRTLTYEDGTRLLIYQPQVTNWVDYSHISARAACAFSAREGETPSLGTFEFEADTEPFLAERLVRMSGFNLLSARFPSLEEADSRLLTARLVDFLPQTSLVISLDRIVANLERVHIGSESVSLKSDPPKIFVSTKPAILILFNGKPIISPIKGSELRFVVNTNWDLFFYPKDRAYGTARRATWSPLPG